MSEASRPERFTLQDVRERTLKRRDSWWTVFLVDPVATRLSVFTANHTRITPNQLTVLALVFGLGAAYLYWVGSYLALVSGAALYHVSFTLDCMDGKIARLKGSGSVFGQWLDYIFDRVRVMACSIALMSGQFRITGDETFLYLAFVVIFLDMLRYMDALQVLKLRGVMRDRIREVRRELSGDLEMSEAADYREAEDEDDAVLPAPRGTDRGGSENDAQPSLKPSAHLQEEFRSRFGWFLRVRDRLMAHRVRPHLFSGIEFQMFIFIVAPLTGAIKPAVLASSALLFVFEAAIIYKLYLSTRDFGRLIERMQRGEVAFPQRAAQDNVRSGSEDEAQGSAEAG